MRLKQTEQEVLYRFGAQATQWEIDGVVPDLAGVASNRDVRRVVGSNLTGETRKLILVELRQYR